MQSETTAIVFSNPAERTQLGTGKMETTIYVMDESMSRRQLDDINGANAHMRYEVGYRGSKEAGLGTFEVQRKVFDGLRAIPDTRLINRAVGRYAFEDKELFRNLPYSRFHIESHLNPESPGHLDVLYDLESQMLKGVVARHMEFDYIREGSGGPKPEKKAGGFMKYLKF